VADAAAEDRDMLRAAIAEGRFDAARRRVLDVWA